MTVYKPRSAWTSSGRGGAQLSGSKLVGIAWHWPGTSQNVIGVESASATANRLRGYRNFHVGSRGWSDVGYNFAIDQAGRVWDLRGLGRVGAHAASNSNPDANHEWMGVLLILGDRERPTAAMIRACQDFRADVFLARWPGRTRDTGHGRAPGVPGAQTSCPGPFAAELIVDGVLTDQPQEEDMPYRDWPQADKDAMVRDIVGAEMARNDGPVQMTPWAAEKWPRHLATGLGQLVGYTAVYARGASGHSKAARNMLKVVREQVQALMDAQQGLDTAAILDRIDARHDEAAADRDEILAALDGADPAEAKLAAILEILGVDA